MNEFFILVIHTQQTKHFVKATSFKYTVCNQKCKANDTKTCSILPGRIFIHICCCCSLLYSAILHSQADLLHSHVIMHEWIAFYSVFLTIHWSGVLTLTVAGATWNCCHLGTFCAPCHFMQSHVRKVHAYLAVTGHLHFLAKRPGSFTCYCSNMGVERIPK